MRDLHHRGDVGDGQRRIGGRLHPDQARARSDRPPDRGQIGQVHEGARQSPAVEHLAQQLSGAVVRVVRRDHVVARGERLEHRGRRRHPRREGECGGSALQRRQRRLERAPRRVLAPGVEEAVRQGAVGLAREVGGEMDRRGHRSGGRVRRVTGVNDQRLDAHSALDDWGDQSAVSSAPAASTASRKRSKSSRRLRWLVTATRSAKRPPSTVLDGTAMPALLHPQQDLLVDRVQRRAVQPGGDEAEADHVERRRGQQLEPRVALHPVAQMARLRDVLLHQPPPGVRPVRLERHPHLERAEAARELDAQLGEGQPAGHDAARRRVEIARGGREGGAVRVGMADQREPDLERQVAPLVQIHRERVGLLHAGHAVAERRRQRGERAERAVHVEPEPLLAAERGERAQVVGGAGVHRAGVADHAERPVPRRAVGRDGGAQRGDVDLVRRVDRDRAGRRVRPGPAARSPSGPSCGSRSSRRAGGAASPRRCRPSRAHVESRADVPRHGQPDQVRHRAAAHQEPAGVRREPQHLRHPSDHLPLDHARATGRSRPGAGSSPTPACRPASPAACRSPSPSPRSAGGCCRWDRAACARGTAGTTAAAVGRAARQRLVERGPGLGGHRAPHRPLAHLLEIVHHVVHHAVAERAERAASRWDRASPRAASCRRPPGRTSAVSSARSDANAVRYSGGVSAARSPRTTAGGIRAG